MQLDTVIRNRHSVRKYLPFHIPDSQLESVLDAANRAPSAGNLQAFKIFAVRGDAKKQIVAKCTYGQDFIVGASIVLIFAAQPEASSKEYGARGSDLYCIQDATIAATFAVLKATDLGYSTAWIGSFDEAMLTDEIGCDGYIPVAIVPIGKAGESPRLTLRKKIGEIVQFLD